MLDRAVRLCLLVAALLALLAGCDMGGASQAVTPSPAATTTPTPPPTPTPTPKEIAVSIGQATQSASSLHFDILLSGKPVYSDPSGLFEIKQIAGDLKRPNGVLAELQAASSGALIDLKVVSLDGKQYLSNPITRGWICVAPQDGFFDPAVLFDPERGVESLIQNDFENATLVGMEEIDGKPHYHLRGSMAGEALMAISSNSLGIGTVDVDLWADAETRRASKLVAVDVDTDAQNPTTWTMNFNEYDKQVDVQVPPGVNC